MYASSDAVTTAGAPDAGDAGADAGWDDEPAPEGDAAAETVPAAEAVPAVEGELEPDAELGGADDAGALLAPVPDGGVEDELEPDGDGDGEGDGLGDGEGLGDGDGDGLGEGELETGSTSHFVSVFALPLAELPGLAEAEATAAAATAEPFAGTARAIPGQPASTPRVRKPPASTLSTTTRTCTRRIKLPCLPSSSGLLSALCGFGGNEVTDGYEYSYPVLGQLCVYHYSRSRLGRLGGSAGSAGRCDAPPPPIGSNAPLRNSHPGLTLVEGGRSAEALVASPVPTGAARRQAAAGQDNRCLVS